MAEIGIYWAQFAPANVEQMHAAQEMVDSYSLDALYLFDYYDAVDAFASAEERIQLLTEACSGIHGNIAVFLATVCDSDDLVERLKHIDGNVHLCLDAAAFRTIDQTHWKQISHRCKCLLTCTEKERHYLAEDYISSLGIEVWNIAFSAATARRMAFLQCGEGYVQPQVLQHMENEHLFGVGVDYKSLPEQDLLAVIQPLYDEKRFLHAQGCREMAVLLAKHYGEDATAAARAGLLHDITKALPVSEQLRLCKKYDIMTECYREDMAKILHGKTAAAVAKEIFGETQEVCSAIAWHTTGRAGMSLLEKIIYMADYIEPNRNFDGVSQLRELAFQDLNAAVVRGIDMTIEILTRRNCPINRDSVEAREYLTLGDMK